MEQMWAMKMVVVGSYTFHLMLMLSRLWQSLASCVSEFEALAVPISFYKYEAPMEKFKITVNYPRTLEESLSGWGLDTTIKQSILMELGFFVFVQMCFLMEEKGLKQWLSVSLREANHRFPLHRRARMDAWKMLSASLNKLKLLYHLTNPQMEMMT